MLIIKRSKLLLLLLVLLISSFSCTTDEGEPTTDDTMVTDDDPGGDDDDGNTQVPPDGFSGVIDWTRSLGGSQIDQATGITASADGNFFVVGTTYSNDGDITDKQGNDADYWVIKMTPTGTVLWSKTYGTTEDELANSIEATNDGGFVISGYSRGHNCGPNSNAGFHDYWLAKFDASGASDWCQNFGFSGSDQGFDAFQTADGGYFATGYFDVSASNGQGNDDRSNQGALHGVGEYWAIKMDASGEFIWRRYFGGSNNDRSYDALQTPDGGFILAGASESDDFDITDSKGSYDLWAVKVSADGDKVWTKSYGGSEIDIGYSMTPTSDGNYLFAGDARSADQDITNSYGNADMWVVKIGPSGNKISQKNYGGSRFDSARKIKQLSSGNYVMVGSTRSNDNDVSIGNGENDAWMVLIDNNLNLLYEKTIGGSNLDFAEDAIELADGSIVIIGNTESNNGNIPGNKGLKDALIVKIK